MVAPVQRVLQTTSLSALEADIARAKELGTRRPFCHVFPSTRRPCLSLSTFCHVISVHAPADLASLSLDSVDVISVHAPADLASPSLPTSLSPPPIVCPVLDVGCPVLELNGQLDKATGGGHDAAHTSRKRRSIAPAGPSFNGSGEGRREEARRGERRRGEVMSAWIMGTRPCAISLQSGGLLNPPSDAPPPARKTRT